MKFLKSTQGVSTKSTCEKNLSTRTSWYFKESIQDNTIKN